MCKPLLEGNSKPFYRHLRGQRPKQHISLLNTDGDITDDPAVCSTILNTHFHNQFNKTHALHGQDPASHKPNCGEIEVYGVIKLLNSLKSGKAPGPDGLKKEDLTLDTEQTAGCLSLIFNKSLTFGKLPAEWKTANVTPIHKSGSKQNANNYRPISLTSIPCKLLEHIVLRNLLEKIDSWLHNRQHGFRKGLSCETQICATLHEIMGATDKKSSVHAAVLDLSKAFDRVPHALLMQKLTHIPGMESYLLDWIHDFLCNRSQTVVLDGAKSESLPVTSGVPQGSVLGPVLFLVYINDLPSHVDCSVGLFADDTLMYQNVDNTNDEERFQANLESLNTWSKTWGMSFNAKKCKIIAFHPQRTVPEYTMDNIVLEHTDHCKYLGVILQSDLKFTDHIADKICSARKQIGMIRRALYWAPERARLIAYKSLCLPHLEYASCAWDPSTKREIEALEIVQNQGVRMICGLKGRRGVTEAKEKLQLEQLVIRRKNSRVKLLNKILSREEAHPALCSSYDEIINQPHTTVSTRSQTRNEPRSIAATGNCFHNSFLPRTIRDMKI